MATLTLNWTAPTPNPDNYTIYYKISTDSSYTTVTVNTNSWSKDGLDCCKAYTGYIKSNCGSNTSPNSDVFSVSAITSCCT